MSLTSISWQLIDTASISATDIASMTSGVNTSGKYEGLMIWDTTNRRLMRARGATDISPWDCVDGLVSVTPS